MVATAPGVPKTSRTSCLGLNGTISLARPLLAAVLLLVPKIPCNRKMANPATATTSTATSTIQPRLTRGAIEIPVTRWPFDDRRHDHSAGLNSLPGRRSMSVSYESTVRDRTEQETRAYTFRSAPSSVVAAPSPGVSGQSRYQEPVDQGPHSPAGGWAIGNDGPEDEVAGQQVPEFVGDDVRGDFPPANGLLQHVPNQGLALLEHLLL